MKSEAIKKINRSVSLLLFIVMLTGTVLSQGVVPVHAQDETPTGGEESVVTETPTIPVEGSPDTVTPEPPQDPTATPTPEDLPTEEVTPTTEATALPTAETTLTPACYPLTLLAAEGQGNLIATTPQNCEGGYIEGTTVTITANLLEGYVVDGWQGTIDDASTALLNIWIAGSNGVVTLLTKEDDVTDQIIGGQGVYPAGKYPWIVVLASNVATGPLENRKFCAGTLISTTMVITAAHCITSLIGNNFNVVAGVHNLQSGTGYQEVHVAKVIKHPNFNPTTYDNDLAVILLATPLVLGGSGATAVGTIPLISSATMPDQNATTIGWGRQSNFYPNTSSTLYEVSLPIMDNETCNDLDHYYGAITANMICAGYDAGAHSACLGDDGGPLFFSDGSGGYFMAGVMSGASGCGLHYRPAVFTRVYNYLSWIASVITNDDFYSATEITAVPSVTTQNTAGTSLSLDDPALTDCGLSTGDASVWYEYTAPADRSITFDTLGSNYDTQLGVFTGTRGALTPVACNDNAGTGIQSRVTFATTAGTTYYIVVSQRWVNNPGGNMVLHAATFGDVDASAWYWPYIEGFYAQGITKGCATANPLVYCPDRSVTRAEMSVFLLRAKYGGTYVPPTGTGVFADLPVTGKEWMQDWVEKFYADGITTGCATSPLAFCPEREVTRSEMAVFILRAKYGSTYVPPTPTTPIFSDVPVAGKEWMQAWIEQFYMEGISTGCGTSPMRYCPEQKVTRMEMAVFLSRAFGFAQLP